MRKKECKRGGGKKRGEWWRINESSRLSKAFLMGCDRNLLTVRAVFNQSACPDELTVPRLQWTFGWPHTSVGP